MSLKHICTGFQIIVLPRCLFYDWQFSALLFSVSIYAACPTLSITPANVLIENSVMNLTCHYDIGELLGAGLLDWTVLFIFNSSRTMSVTSSTIANQEALSVYGNVESTLWSLHSVDLVLSNLYKFNFTSCTCALAFPYFGDGISWTAQPQYATAISRQGQSMFGLTMNSIMHGPARIARVLATRSCNILDCDVTHD